MIGAAIAFAMLAPTAVAQAGPSPAAQATDGAQIEALVAQVYAVISGPAGPRDWERFRALFVPEGRLVPVSDRGPAVLTVQSYIDRAAPVMAKEGFYEREIARRVERYGNIAHVFSTYESRHSPDGAPFARGINSIQLVRVNGTWRVLQVAWQAETAAWPVPGGYLPKSDRR